jgi:DNA (cytosine-5)-methyltransferase 1
MRHHLLSLFSGAGGLDVGFARAGFETVLALDNSPDAVRTYNHNLGRTVAYAADLSALTPDGFLRLVPAGSNPIGLIGGPPCQGFSRGNVSATIDDPRNLLPYRYANLLKAANEKYGLHFFVFENVVGLARKKHGGRFSRLCNKLCGAGFNIFHAELDAGGFGVPQRRLRLFIVGLNSKLYPGVTFQFPNGSTQRATVADVLDGMPDPAFYRRGLLASEIPHHPNHWTMVPKSRKFNLCGSCGRTGRSFKRLDWNSVSPTVAYGHREIHVHPQGDRRLSVYEAMLLQGFPPRYQLTGTLSSQITQVSNAVPPPVAQAIAEVIAKVLRRGNGRPKSPRS